MNATGRETAGGVFFVGHARQAVARQAVAQSRGRASGGRASGGRAVRRSRSRAVARSGSR